MEDLLSELCWVSSSKYPKQEFINPPKGSDFGSDPQSPRNRRMSSAFKTKLVFSFRWAAIPVTKTSKQVGCKEESFDSILPGIESISWRLEHALEPAVLLLSLQGMQTEYWESEEVLLLSWRSIDGI